MVRSSWVWMLCSEIVRVSLVAAAPVALNRKRAAANPTRRAARACANLSPVFSAPPARTCGLALRGRSTPKPCRQALSHRNGMANAVLPGWVNADFTPPPSPPPIRHPAAGVWRKKANKIQGLRWAVNSWAPGRPRHRREPFTRKTALNGGNYRKSCSNSENGLPPRAALCIRCTCCGVGLKLGSAGRSIETSATFRSLPLSSAIMVLSRP